MRGTLLLGHHRRHGACPNGVNGPSVIGRRVYGDAPSLSLRIVRHVPAGEGSTQHGHSDVRRGAALVSGGGQARGRPAHLEIGDGEFMVLVGPSGCGKSTSLRMLAGLEEVNSGAIFIGDREITHMPPKDRDIAMVFQNYALYPHMSVADNMALRAEDRQGAGRGAQAAGGRGGPDPATSTEYLDRKPKALSGGQRQRVAMGRAIVRSPAGLPAWTSRCRTSTRRCGWPPAPTSPSSRPTSGSPPST